MSAPRLGLIPGPLEEVLLQVQDLSVSLDFTARFVSSKFANAAEALTTIGTTKPTILVLDTTLEVASPAVFTPNILVQSMGGKFQKTGTGTIQFQGLGIGQVDAMMPLFSGFAAGDITFSGTLHPRALSNEWWDTGNDSLQDRFNRADLSVVGKACTIVAFPRTLTSATAIVGEKHSLIIAPGEYLNTCATYLGSNWPPFLMKNNSSIIGMPGNKIYESAVNGNGWLIYAWHTRSGGGETTGFQENLHVEGIRYVSSDLAMWDTTGGSSGILVGNCINAKVIKCRFEFTKNYAILVGLYGTAGNYARNVVVDDNEFIGVGTQALALINGIGIRIRRNYFNQANSAGISTYSLIDVEPNLAEDRVEDLTIDDNEFDCRDVTDGSKYVGAIAIQAALQGSIKNVQVSRNKAYGANLSTSGTMLPLTSGITLFGVWEAYVFENTVRSAFQRAYNISQCRDIHFWDARGLQCTDVNGDNAAMVVEACYNSTFKDLVFRESANTNRQATGLIERELDHPVTTSGLAVTSIYDVGSSKLFFDLYVGLSVVINDVEYTVASFTTHTIIQLTVSVGTLTKEIFVDADVDVGANSIDLSAHGHNTGSRVWLSTTGVVPGGLSPSSPFRLYYIIRIDADTVKLADTYEDALAEIAINILNNTGGGTHTITPVMRTKFSSNKFENCDCPDGITIEPSGTSILVPSILDYEPPDKSITFLKTRDIGGRQLLGRGSTPTTIDPVSYQNVQGQIIQPAFNNRQKKIVGDSWSNSGAFSVEALVKDGYAEWICPSDAGDRMFGLSAVDTDQNFTTILRAFALNPSWGISIYESGTSPGTAGTATPGVTIFRMERTGDQFTYKVDGTIVRGPHTIITDPLHVDTSIYTANATITGAKISGEFGNIEELTPAIVHEILGERFYFDTITPGEVPANTTEEQTFSFPGLDTDDVVVVNGPAPTVGTGIVGARVSAADTLAINFSNITAGPLTPASGVYSIRAINIALLF